MVDYLRQNIENGSEFTGAEFLGQDIMKIHAHSVSFNRCILNFCNFNDASMHNARFTDCTITKCNFIRAELVSAVFSNCVLTGSVFVYTKLTHANFHHNDLEGVEFNGANLSGADFKKNKLKGAEFSGANTHSMIIDHNVYVRNLHMKLRAALVAIYRCNLKELGNHAATNLIGDLTIALADFKGTILAEELGRDTAASIIYMCSHHDAPCIPAWRNSIGDSITELDKIMKEGIYYAK